MSETNETSSACEDEAPTHFVVEVQHKGRTAFALCERVLIVEDTNVIGIDPGHIRRFLEGSARVPAAALLKCGDASTGQAGKLTTAQAGKVREISIDIHGNPTLNFGAPPEGPRER